MCFVRFEEFSLDALVIAAELSVSPAVGKWNELSVQTSTLTTLETSYINRLTYFSHADKGTQSAFMKNNLTGDCSLDFNNNSTSLISNVYSDMDFLVAANLLQEESAAARTLQRLFCLRYIEFNRTKCLWCTPKCARQLSAGENMKFLDFESMQKQEILGQEK